MSFSAYSADTMTGQIIQEGFIDCFAEGLAKNNKPVYCEASGVIYLNKNLIVVNDRPIPHQSPIFSIKYPELSVNHYLREKNIIQATKYEDIAFTTDKKFVIAITAFDRIETNSHELDNYNNIVYWQNSKPKTATILSSQPNQHSSIELRSKIAAALGYPAYYKIEGLAILPNELLIGIRSMGKSYQNFNNVFKIISVHFEINHHKILLKDDFKLAYDFDLSTYPNNSLKSLNMGLSSIHYDHSTQSLWILTSSENKDKLNSVLWNLSLTDFEKNNPPKIIVNSHNQPIFFNHKAEGITLIDKHKLFIIYDDDTVNIGDKKPNQAFYTIVEIQN